VLFSSPAIGYDDGGMGSTLYKPRPRQVLQFSLRTLLIGVTLACVALWIGPDLWLVQQRQAMRQWITSRGGHVTLLSEFRYPRERFPDIRISDLRQWLGDEAVVEITLPSRATPESLARTLALFAEAETVEGGTGGGMIGGGMGGMGGGMGGMGAGPNGGGAGGGFF
jgi:hypothetical protein